jgi:DNA-binding response OmpR family regulator
MAPTGDAPNLMRILVVEDDRALAESIAQGLEEAGMAVDTVSDGEAGLAAALTVAYDVVVLDVMLPQRDGFQVSAGLRDRRVQTPILMLTGRDSVDDRVTGLESGADDYLAKPFAFRELVARVKALSRRHLAARAAVLRSGVVELDMSARTITVRGRPLVLTAKELAIMEFFLLHQGQVLNREQILENVWDYSLEDGRNLVEVYMARLRKKLADAGLPDAFMTTRGLGYRFQAPTD